MIITTWILVFRKDYIWKRARAWKKHGKDQKLDALSIFPHMPFPDTLQIYRVFQLEDTVSGTDLWNARRCSGTLSSARLSSNHSTTLFRGRFVTYNVAKHWILRCLYTRTAQGTRISLNRYSFSIKTSSSCFSPGSSLNHEMIINMSRKLI
jgi:hypothetical protein